jgi:hypothetical protein
MIDTKYEAALVKAFRDLHGCEAKHVETVPVIELPSSENSKNRRGTK